MDLFLQLEDNWEQEKKIRGEVEKARRKAEADLKMTIDNLNEMERAKIDLEEVVKKYVQLQYTVQSKYRKCTENKTYHHFQEGSGN